MKTTSRGAKLFKRSDAICELTPEIQALFKIKEDKIKPADLICPLDVHVVGVANNLGILQNNKVNWETAIVLTEYLKILDPKDPIKYDFALFGMGVNKELL